MSKPTTEAVPAPANGAFKGAPTLSSSLDVDFGDEEQMLFEELNKEVVRTGLRIERHSLHMLEPVYKKRNATLRTKVPKLWPVAMMHHQQLASSLADSEDQEAMSYLREVTVTRDKREPRAYRIDFHFDPNPYFNNTVLTKDYVYTGTAEETPIDDVTDDHMEFDPDLHLQPKAFPIDWKAGKKLTDLIPRKIDEEGDVIDSGSFFHFFEVAEDENGIGYQIVEDIYPEVLDYFLGKGEMSMDMDEDDEDITDDEDDDDDEDEEEIDLEQPPKKRKRDAK